VIVRIISLLVNSFLRIRAFTDFSKKISFVNFRKIMVFFYEVFVKKKRSRCGGAIAWWGGDRVMVGDRVVVVRSRDRHQ
jgi:hypothetical protein